MLCYISCLHRATPRSATLGERSEIDEQAGHWTGPSPVQAARRGAQDRLLVGERWQPLPSGVQARYRLHAWARTQPANRAHATGQHCCRKACRLVASIRFRRARTRGLTPAANPRHESILAALRPPSALQARPLVRPRAPPKANRPQPRWRGTSTTSTGATSCCGRLGPAACPADKLLVHSLPQQLIPSGPASSRTTPPCSPPPPSSSGASATGPAAAPSPTPWRGSARARAPPALARCTTWTSSGR